MDLKERTAEAIEFLNKKKIIVIDGRMDADLEDIVLACLRKALEQEYKELTIIFNSEGGNWITGIAIYNAILLLRASGTTVRGIIMASCCSAAAVVFQACTTREIMQGSHMLMHWGRSTLNNAEQASLRRGKTEWVIRQINEANEAMLRILASRSKVSKKILATMCDNEERIMDVYAVELGLADRMVTDKTVMKLFNRAKRTEK